MEDQQYYVTSYVSFTVLGENTIIYSIQMDNWVLEKANGYSIEQRSTSEYSTGNRTGLHLKGFRNWPF